MKPLLSIAIPTKNRQKYCKYAITSILENKEDYFELIIQDNSDDNSLSEFIENIADKRLRYFYTKQPLSSIANINLSVERTEGDYVCMIGDDDTILPSIFKVLDIMRQNNFDSVCPSFLPAYIWPNELIGESGTILISKPRRKTYLEVFDVNKRLKKLFMNGIIDYQQYQLPRLYHGIIRRDVLDKIKKKINSYFEGLSPDIYSTVALSSLVNKHVVINEAISIAGACPQSTTAQNKDGGHRGELKEAPHLKYKPDYKWDNLVPRFYSVETIWAETAIKAARDFGLDKEIKSFNPVYLVIVAYWRNKEIRNIILREYPFSKWVRVSFVIFVWNFGFQVVKRFLTKYISQKQITFNDITNINKVKQYI